MKQFDQELVSGSIFRSVWKLAWPVIALQLMSGIHGFVDHVLVGNFVQDPAANAAIGVSWQLFLVMVVFIASLFHGMGVLIARYSGKQDREAVNRVAYDTFLASFWILVLVAAPIGYFLTPQLLNLVNAEEAVQVYARPYLRLLFTASVPLFLMFMLNGAFQATGDPRTPLMLGVLTTVCNVTLSTCLIIGVGPFPELGTLGAAVGTVLGPIPSVVISILLILRHKMLVGPPEHFTIIPDFSVVKTVARIGIPTGIQAVLLNVAGAVVIGFVGSLEHSAEAQAAYTICYAQLFSFVTWASFGLRASSATIMGQNLGAGKPERAKQGVYVTMGMAVAWSMVWASIYLFFPDVLLSFFKVTEGTTFDIGVDFLRFLSISAFFVATALTLTGGIQGAGDTVTPMYIAFISQIVVLLGLCTVFQALDMLSPRHIWFSILMAHVARMVLSVLAFRREGLTSIKVELESKRETAPDIDATTPEAEA